MMLAISLCFFGVTACKGEENMPKTYEQITPKQAKEIMEKEKDYIILDVRTAEEFQEGHIPGAVNLDHEETKARAGEILPEKGQLILVYCRSGRRSKIAAETLLELGYTNVKEFGGILDWPYEIVKE